MMIGSVDDLDPTEEMLALAGLRADAWDALRVVLLCALRLRAQVLALKRIKPDSLANSCIYRLGLSIRGDLPVMRFKRLDLNLLVVLDALLRQRSVTRAARELHLSQPAMSAALARLRQYFNDDILVAHGKQMVPTPHAQNLAPMVESMLRDIEGLIQAAAVFEPATSHRNFRICASDYVAVVLLQPLLVRIEQIAPGVSVQILPPNAEALPKLERGEVDFLLTPEQFTAKEHPKTLLFEEQHVVVGWKENPVFAQPMTEESFLSKGQVIMAVGHVQSFFEQEMGELSYRRKFEVVCASFLQVPWMLPNTQRLAVMQERLARLMVQQLPLAMAPLPFSLPPMREVIQYHAARIGDGGIKWLLQEILNQAALLNDAVSK